MKIINKISVAKKVILSEAAALKNIANKLDHNFNLACEAILACKGKVVTIGLGKSGHIATKSAATLSSTGTPSVFLHAAEALHGDIGLISKLDLVICYSNSGETKELLLLLPLLKILKITLITVTGNKKSMLAKSSNIVLDSSVQSEACPLNLTPTSSVISAIGLSDALAITLLKCRGFTSKDFAKSHPQGELGKRLLKKTEDIMIIKRLPYAYTDMKLISIDVCSAIVVKILNCEAVVTNKVAKFPSFTHMKPYCQGWNTVQTSWQDQIGVYISKDGSTKLGNYAQTGILHYTEKDFVEKSPALERYRSLTNV